MNQKNNYISGKLIASPAQIRLFHNHRIGAAAAPAVFGPADGMKKEQSEDCSKILG